jgi:hypothetical protein
MFITINTFFKHIFSTLKIWAFVKQTIFTHALNLSSAKQWRIAGAI